MKTNERLQALHILKSLLENKISLSASLQNKEATPLAREICFGVCRHYFKLEAICNRFLKKQPKSTEVWCALLMGLYQLHYLRIPDYAVVKETVALMDAIKKPWAKGLVNAVLRSYCRQSDALLTALQNHETFLYNHPQWFIKKIKAAWPMQWKAILEANDAHPPMSLRVNRLRTSTNAYLLRLNENNISAKPHTNSPAGIELHTPCDVYDLPSFREGFTSVQDQAAQLAALLLDLKPGLRVLDACAAPGGKTCHILETEPELASCMAIDLDAGRLKQVQENLDRLNLKAELLAADAANPYAWWNNKTFDRILLDAPCSATGVIRRHPDIKLLRTPQDIANVVQLQKKLLNALWRLLAPGGRMVYATCSIMPEENDLQIKEFLHTHPDCNIQAITQSWGQSTPHGRQILPGEDNMDGFFYCVLVKNA